MSEFHSSYDNEGTYQHVEDEAVRAEFNAIFHAEEEAQQEELSERDELAQYNFAVWVEAFEQSLDHDMLEVPSRYALYAEKTWAEKDGDHGTFREAISSVKLAEVPFAEQDSLQQTALELQRLVDSGDLAFAMQRAEKLAASNGFLDPQRSDPRLFTAGPADDFATLREMELDEAREAFEQFEAGLAEAASGEAIPYTPIPNDLEEMSSALGDIETELEFPVSPDDRPGLEL